MLKIEVKDQVCDMEIQGTFTEVMTELTLAVASLLKTVAKEEKMPSQIVRESFMAAFAMTAGKEDVYEFDGEASEGAPGIGH